jgi:hypothetical protein
MIPAIGTRVLVRYEQVQIECTVTNVKNSWGQARLCVTPVAGFGQQWVEMGRVSLPPTIHAGQKHEHSAERQPAERCTEFNYCSECRGWFKPLPRIASN